MAITYDPFLALPNGGIDTGLGFRMQSAGAPASSIDPTQAGPPVAPSTTIAPPSASQQAGGVSTPQEFFNQLFPSDTLTPEMLTQQEAILNAHGIKLVRNAAGVPGKIQLPDGSVVDVIQGAGSGLNKKQWLTGGGGGGGSLGDLGYSFGSSLAPWTQQFSAPTAEQAQNTPGFQFAMQQGLNAIQNSAAARGTLLTGGTLKGLENYAVGTGLQSYGDIYNRAMGEYLLNRENFYNNEDRPFNKNLSLATLGKPA
jgi:hypothetical protein